MIFCDEQTRDLRIAALTLSDRLVVAVHRAGAGPITLVSPGRSPHLDRATALGIPVRSVAEAPPCNGTTLVAATDLLVQTADVRELLRCGGRLAGHNGDALSIGVLPTWEPMRCAPSPLPEEREGAGGGHSWKTALDGLPVRVATGVARRVRDEAMARTVERVLWDSLTSSTDGFVDRVFNRPCGRPLSKLLIHTPVTPNAVSLASIFIGVAAAWFFARGDYMASIVAALLFQLSAIVDCVDGDVARVVFKESPLGKWLDLGGDQIVHLAVFAAIALGLDRTGQTAHAPGLGLSAVAGAAVSFAVVLRGLKRPPADGDRTLQRLIDSATNRDFSVLVLVLACFQKLEWFLWLTAIGTHLFWITALSLQLRSRIQRAWQR